MISFVNNTGTLLRSTLACCMSKHLKTFIVSRTPPAFLFVRRQLAQSHSIIHLYLPPTNRGPGEANRHHTGTQPFRRSSTEGCRHV
jgi:hypothetical protein